MLLLIDTSSGKELRRLKHSSIAASFTCDGRTLFAWGRPRLLSNPLQRWDVATGKHNRPLLYEEQVGIRSFNRVAFSPDGRFVALAGRNGYVPVMDVATGREVCRFPNQTSSRGDVAENLAFSPDGRTLAWSNQHEGQSQAYLFDDPSHAALP